MHRPPVHRTPSRSPGSRFPLPRRPLQWKTRPSWLRTCSDVLLDRYADQRAVLRPRAVVVLHVRLVEDLVQDEPRVRRPLADAAVSDRVLAEVHAFGLVELAQLVVGEERAVFVRGLRPRDVLRGRHVTGALRLLLRQMRGRKQTSTELIRRTHVDEVLLADRVDNLI